MLSKGRDEDKGMVPFPLIVVRVPLASLALQDAERTNSEKNRGIPVM